MKKIISILSILIVGTCNCFSQSSNNKNNPYCVPSPNAASLGSFGTVPVSPYSGKADISIPLYNTTVRDVALDVTMRYDTSGSPVNMLPGWTGHGWTICAGGAITRKINYMPDEMSFAGTNAGYDRRYDYYIGKFKKEEPILNCSCSDWENPNAVAAYNLCVANYNVAHGKWKDAKKKVEKARDKSKQEYKDFKNYFTSAKNLNISGGEVDEGDYAIRSCDDYADEFYFSFMGKTGCFYFGNDGNWKVRCNENIAVEFDVNNQSNYITVSESQEKGFLEQSSVKVIKGFTLIDADGTRYKFGGDETSMELSTDLLSISDNNYSSCWNAVTWMLKSVEDRFGNVLYTFTYSKGNPIAQIHLPSFQFTQRYDKVDYTLKSRSASLIRPVYLDNITTSDGTSIVFSHSTVYSAKAAWKKLYPNLNIDDLLKSRKVGLFTKYNLTVNYYCKEKLEGMNMEKLNKVSVLNNGNNITSFDLTYSLSPRMHLCSIKQSAKSKKIGTYTFDYNRYTDLPASYLTEYHDYWGFYNKEVYSGPELIGENDEILNQIQTRSTIITEDPKVLPNVSASTYGMMTKITYPTGGYTAIGYEQNCCKKYIDMETQGIKYFSENTLVGGLRISYISTYNNVNDTEPVSRTNYSYRTVYSNNTESNVSSGEFSCSPIIAHEWNDNGKCTVTIENSLIPLSTLFGPTLGYTYVTETHLDGSKIIHRFSNISDERDIMENKSRFTKSPVFYVFNDRSYMRGLKMSEKILSSSGAEMCRKNYTYTSDVDYNRNNYICSRSVTSIGCLSNNDKKSHKYSVSNLYRIYYFSPKVKQIVTETNHGGNWVSETTAINNDYRDVSVTNNMNFAYKTNISNVNSVTTKRASQELMEKYTFPYDEDGANKDLVKQFCLPVTATRIYHNGKLAKGEKTVYGIAGGKYCVPMYKIAFAGSEFAQDTVARYQGYDTSYRLADTYDENGVRHGYFWDTKGRLVATVDNMPNSLVLNNGALNANKIFKDNVDLYGSSPVNVTSCIFNKRGLISEISKDNNQTTSYKYDVASRLAEVHNKHGHKVQKYAYNYATSETGTSITENDEVEAATLATRRIFNPISKDSLSCISSAAFNTSTMKVTVCYILAPKVKSAYIEFVSKKTGNTELTSPLNVATAGTMSISVSNITPGDYNLYLVADGIRKNYETLTISVTNVLPDFNNNGVYLIKDAANKTVTVFYQGATTNSYVMVYKETSVAANNGIKAGAQFIKRSVSSGKGYVVLNYSSWPSDNYLFFIFVGGVDSNCIRGSQNLQLPNGTVTQSSNSSTTSSSLVTATFNSSAKTVNVSYTLASTVKSASIELVSMSTGQTVLTSSVTVASSGSKSINVSELKSGGYYVFLVADGVRKNYKTLTLTLPETPSNFSGYMMAVKDASAKTVTVYYKDITSNGSIRVYRNTTVAADQGIKPDRQYTMQTISSGKGQVTFNYSSWPSDNYLFFLFVGGNDQSCIKGNQNYQLP